MIGKLFVVSLVALVGCTSAAPWLDGKIVGGFPVNISQVPWQVSLVYSGSHLCGGSIINNRWILTAGHCIGGDPASRFVARVGSTDQLSGGQIYTIDKAITHQKFGRLDYDYGLLRTTEEIQFNERVQPVQMPGPDDADIENETTCLVSGWGNTRNSSESNRYLRAVEVPKVDLKLCNKAYGGRITKRMFCAGLKKGGKDSCQGDSGGPVVVFDSETKAPTVVGIVSWGNGCAKPGFPGVYAKVLTERQWIQEHTGI